MFAFLLPFIIEIIFDCVAGARLYQPSNVPIPLLFTLPRWGLLSTWSPWAPLTNINGRQARTSVERLKGCLVIENSVSGGSQSALQVTSHDSKDCYKTGQLFFLQKSMVSRGLNTTLSSVKGALLLVSGWNSSGQKASPQTSLPDLTPDFLLELGCVRMICTQFLHENVSLKVFFFWFAILKLMVCISEIFGSWTGHRNFAPVL